MSGWTTVHDEPGERVRRISVPGGWLYQVELDLLTERLAVGEPAHHHTGWHPPVFVPTAAEGT